MLPELNSCPFNPTELKDRRYFPRVRVDLPAIIDIYNLLLGKIDQIECRATNISDKALALYVQPGLSLSNPFQIELKLPGDDSPLKVTCETRWMKSNRNGKGFDYGVCISHILPHYQTMIQRFIARTITDKSTLKDRRVQSKLHSELFQLTNRRGKRLVGFVDYPMNPEVDLRDAYIVVPPAYGETKTGALTIAYYFAANGFNVVRFDASDHVGESDGDLMDCTLQKMREDLIDVINYFQNNRRAKWFGLVASSLAARVAIKAATSDKRVQFLGCLVPVINLQHTLNRVYNEDLVGHHLEGKTWGVIDMLGFPIKSDQFLGDAAVNDYHSLDSTIDDVMGFQIPFCFVVGKKDPWVNYSEVEKLFALAPQPDKDLLVLAETIHQLSENPLMIKGAFKSIVRKALEVVRGVHVALDEVKDPPFREVALQARLEKERMRVNISMSSDPQQVEFWSHYLERFHFIIRVPHYKEFYKQITNMLGPREMGHVLLDAGCGNGSFGIWLLSETIGPTSTNRGQGLTYVGADFVPKALEFAMKSHQTILAETNMRETAGKCHLAYNVVDLSKPIPYMDNYFDQICCNLVLSYLPNPTDCFDELYRTLKPGGRLVVTSLKPYPDLSLIYRSFLEVAKNSEEGEAARRLLNNSSLILENERQGKFRFFGEGELLTMVEGKQVTLKVVERGFGNQANILMVQK